MAEHLNIAIDGPSGAGKSTLAKAVATALHIRYLDTGSMYRAMALFAMRQGVSVSDEAGLQAILDDADIRVSYDERGQRVLLCGEDVTDGLRTQELGMDASTVSTHPCVRQKLAELQREVGRNYDVVMDGRDITTNVLPHTKYKFLSPLRRRCAPSAGSRNSARAAITVNLMSRCLRISKRATIRTARALICRFGRRKTR